MALIISAVFFPLSFDIVSSIIFFSSHSTTFSNSDLISSGKNFHIASANFADFNLFQVFKCSSIAEIYIFHHAIISVRLKNHIHELKNHFLDLNVFFALSSEGFTSRFFVYGLNFFSVI